MATTKLERLKNRLPEGINLNEALFAEEWMVVTKTCSTGNEYICLYRLNAETQSWNLESSIQTDGVPSKAFHLNVRTGQAVAWVECFEEVFVLELRGETRILKESWARCVTGHYNVPWVVLLQNGRIELRDENLGVLANLPQYPEMTHPNLYCNRSETKFLHLFLQKDGQIVCGTWDRGRKIFDGWRLAEDLPRMRDQPIRTNDIEYVWQCERDAQQERNLYRWKDRKFVKTTTEFRNRGVLVINRVAIGRSGSSRMGMVSNWNNVQYTIDGFEKDAHAYASLDRNRPDIIWVACGGNSTRIEIVHLAPSLQDLACPAIAKFWRSLLPDSKHAKTIGALLHSVP